MALLFIAVLAPIVMLGIALAFGGPKAVAPMASINDPFRYVDFTDLPPLSSFIARDGSALRYRRYAGSGAAPVGSVILIHGSSASSASMHPLAKAFAGKGYAVYALDMRGHGASGPKGTISYVGQLEDDLEDFVRATSPEQPSTLAGFSAGGGFVLRVAGSQRQNQFQSCLLLSPFLGQDAPTYRPGSGGWVSVGMARVIAIDLLNRIGIAAFNQLPVTAFALNEKARAFLTPAYSFALMSNFRPHRDYTADIRSTQLPCAVLVGEADEVFDATRFEQAFRAQGKNWPVHMVPRLGHIPLTLEPTGLAQAVDAVKKLQRLGNTPSH
ncbi:alpha/beta hydrolase [Noviherbaspirillum sp. DKR-6]|uniref:Alpha/beta hydrolase n=2 Tax=Noviherbaspirillum pedocola TaxID=2801341 RepID=A0A934SWZ1_9BURK|nr:alpha/beta hydrolase [Noviherbaspirillum pedocola]